MSNMDITLQETMLAERFSFRINRMFNSTVHSHWGFTDRVNMDQHLIYVKSGLGFYIIEGKNVPLVKGQLIFVSRGTKHSAGFDRTNNPGIIPIRFSLYDGQIQVDSILSKPFALVRSFKQRHYVETLMERLFLLFTRNEQDQFVHVQINSLLKLVLMTLLEQETSSQVKDQRIMDTLNKIHESPWKKFTLKDLASSCNLSNKQFSRLFQKETNRSPIDYLCYFRCQYAAEELDNTLRPVQSIAFDLGYPDSYTFSKQFKKYMGLSPTQWRKRENVFNHEVPDTKNNCGSST